ncbi:hypothetical protein FKM82_020186 [Ascaphus truei]
MFLNKKISNLRKPIGQPFQNFSSAQPSHICIVSKIIEITVTAFVQRLNKLSMDEGTSTWDVIHDFHNLVHQSFQRVSSEHLRTHILLMQNAMEGGQQVFHTILTQMWLQSRNKSRCKHTHILLTL